MKVHNLEYQPPVNSGTRVIRYTIIVNYQKTVNFNGTYILRFFHKMDYQNLPISQNNVPETSLIF